jgi:hypothetical protein
MQIILWLKITNTKFMMQNIRLNFFAKQQLQSIRLDNAAKFSSRAFNDYCMPHGIQVQHLVSYMCITKMVWLSIL